MDLGRGAKALLIVAAAFVVVAGLRAAGPLLVPLLAAVFITVLSMPVVRELERLGVPQIVAILLAVVLDLALFAGVAGLVGGSLNEFYERVPQYQERLGMLAEQGANWLVAQGMELDAEALRRRADQFAVLSLVADLFQSLAALLSKALMVALLVLFMLFEAGSWQMKLAYIVGRPTHDLPRFAAAAREVQTYLVVKSALSLVTGVLCGGFVAICGLDFALLWGILAFVLNYIPTLGMFIATVPPVAVALIQGGPSFMLLILVGYVVINFTLGNFVEPRVMGRALGLSPLVVFLSMVFWGWMWGAIGALLAVPLSMVMKIVFSNIDDVRWAAVLLGSKEWLLTKRADWGDPVEEERRRSQRPPAPAATSETTVGPNLSVSPSYALPQAEASRPASVPNLEMEDAESAE